MMGSISKQLQDFMAKHKIAKDEVWEVRNGAYAIKHFAIERIAAKAGIRFDRPAFLEHDTASGAVSMVVFGKLGEREEWSTGEASPKNNKNAYPFAMAEKRAKGRVALKLLLAVDDVDAALYSEEDSEDFKQDKRQNPHVTRPADIVPAAEYDQHGEIIDNIPHAPAANKLRVADQRPLFEAIQREAHAFGDEKAFIAWMNDKNVIARVADFKADWQAIFRGVCKEHLIELRKQSAGDSQRMAS